MMDSCKVANRVQEVWNDLPTIFTVRDVCGCIGLSDRRPENRVAVHTALDRLAAEGRLFPSLVLGPKSGRRPSAWSKVPEGARDRVVAYAVRAVLFRMPRYFTVDGLIAEIGLSRRLLPLVLAALRELEVEGRVVSVSELPFQNRSGRRPKLWSANSDVITSERSFRALVAGKEGSRADNAVARLERLLKPFDPFRE